jgi:L-arabinokinase
VRRRTLDELRAAGDPRWFAPALDRLRVLPDESDPSLRDFLVPDAPVVIGRAPGRLDVMGGIADYSGALVLELPLDRATFAIVQRQREPRLDVVSLRSGRAHRFRMPLDALTDGELRSPEALASWFAGRGDDRWAAYVVGVVSACLTRARSPAGGLRVLIESTVPEGKGVSSSAALEVACLAAVAAHLDVEMTAGEMAAACQWAENHIAGAPCGIMDQMTAACGRRDRLLRLRCQPGTVEGYVGIPDGWRFHGIDSGIRHAVTGADYGTVRTAAFMGYRMIAELAGLPVWLDGEMVHVDDPVWHGYLTNIPPDEFAERFEQRLPERMLGEEFLARHGGITDTVTRVAPDRWYPVRQATAHPVREQARVARFADLLGGLPTRPGAAAEMGALMVESHESYGRCGLGSDGTDRLVALVAEAGAERGLFGAKITGGGSGGTVAILATDRAEPAVREIARRYEEETGRDAELFTGSGPGAEEAGVLVLEPGEW